MTKAFRPVPLILGLISVTDLSAQEKRTLVAPALLSNNRDDFTTLTPDGKTMYFRTQRLIQNGL